VSATRPAWEIGDELESRTLPPVTRSQLAKYAEASGDHNPIHTTDEAAEEAGLPGVIAHGMLTAATMGLLFSPYLEHGYVKELRARFSGMVYPGDELTVGGHATGVEEGTEGSLYAFDVYAKKGEDTVASGTVDFLVYEDR
jgi:acyl dehydratase